MKPAKSVTAGDGKHMKAEILAVGTELLMGQIANTNAQYISSRLPDAGIEYIITVWWRQP